MISPDEFIPAGGGAGAHRPARPVDAELGSPARPLAGGGADLVLSINLSPLQFRDPELCPQISPASNATARPRQLELGDHRRGADGKRRRNREQPG